MALEQATAQQRMGQSVIRRLANALLVPEGSVAVEGVLAQRPGDVPMGASGMQGTDVGFRAIASELPADLARGTPCTVFVGSQRQLLHGLYTVRHREDNVLIDTAQLDLERAA